MRSFVFLVLVPLLEFTPRLFADVPPASFDAECELTSRQIYSSEEAAKKEETGTITVHNRGAEGEYFELISKVKRTLKLDSHASGLPPGSRFYIGIASPAVRINAGLYVNLHLQTGDVKSIRASETRAESKGWLKTETYAEIFRVNPNGNIQVLTSPQYYEKPGFWNEGETVSLPHLYGTEMRTALYNFNRDGRDPARPLNIGQWIRNGLAPEGALMGTEIHCKRQ